MDTVVEADGLRQEGNALFVKAKYRAACAKYEVHALSLAYTPSLVVSHHETFRMLRFRCASLSMYVLM
jgi:hypothetical protein